MATLIELNPLFLSTFTALLVTSICLVIQNRSLTFRLAKIQKKLDHIVKSQSFVNESTVGLGQRLIALEGKVKKIKAGSDAMTFGSDDFAFSQAVQLFDQGADVDTVVNSCGLSTSEASLMALIRSQMSSKENKASEKPSAKAATPKATLNGGAVKNESAHTPPGIPSDFSKQLTSVFAQ